MEERLVKLMLFEGRLRVTEKSTLRLTDDDMVTLNAALAIQSSSLAGPPLEGSRQTLALAAAVVYRFAWRFFNPEPLALSEDPTLRMPTTPRTPAEHAGADIAFRLLPGLYTRMVACDAGNPLCEALKKLLREWPLSGVLADIPEPPETPIDFAGHIGLGFLYAERLAANERPAWIPGGAMRECVDAVYQSLGKRLRDEIEASTGAPES